MAGLLLSDAAGGNFNLALADGGTLPVQAIPPGGGGVGTVTNVTGSAGITVTPGAAGAASYNVALTSPPSTGTVTNVTGSGAVVVTPIGAGAGAYAVALAPGFEPQLLFPNIAAMSAYSIVAPYVLQTGQQALVQSNGSVWTLQLAPSSPAVDGIRQVAAAGAAGAVWSRNNKSAYLPDWLLQAAWFIDPQNVTGLASDENSGATALLPLLSKAEVYRRWGYTWSGKLNSFSVVVTYLSPDVTGSTDAGLFAPELHNGATFLQTAALPAATFTGTLLAVTPKSVAGNQALAATFTTTTGAVAVRMLLVNSTRANSEAWAVRNAAGTWTLTQPLAAWVPGTSAVRAAVNTWANGDAISGYAPMTVATSVVGGVLSAYDATFSPGHAVWHLLLADLGASSFGLTQMTVHNECFPALIACDIERPALIDLEQGAVSGCVFGSNGPTINSQGGNGFVQGGWVPSGDLRCQFLNDTIVAGTLHDSFITTANDIYVDSGQTLTVQGQESLAGTAAIYGPGILNVKGYLTTSGTAVATLPIATKHLNGVATGYSNATAAGVTTVHGGIALTSANIDAAAGAAGFGGLAYTPGATIAVTTVQP